MVDNPHFVSFDTWEDAAAMLAFEPRQPRETLGYRLENLAVHVLDHRKRELPVGGRSLEAHYGAFVVTQAHKGVNEARRGALSVAYGRDARTASVHGHEARMYELGPEVPPDDIDGRSPAVVTWHDDGVLYLVASGELEVQTLLEIAGSLYGQE